MERFKSDFPSILNGISFETLENSSDSIYCLSKEFEIIYYNPAYIGFAKENDQDANSLNKFPIGTSILKALSGDKIGDYYIENYKKVLDTGKVWHHELECSSTKEYRYYRQLTYPFKSGEGLVVINALRVNQPMAEMNRKASLALKTRYTQSTGYITQCCNCRHTQRADKPEIWDWIPAWVEKMPKNMSHSICPTCMDYYWKIDKFEDHKRVKDKNLV